VLLYLDAFAATARILNHLGLRWTLRSAGFEAANFGLLAGSEALQVAASRRLIDEALAIGARTVILPECGHAYPALRWDARQSAREVEHYRAGARAERVSQEAGTDADADSLREAVPDIVPLLGAGAAGGTGAAGAAGTAGGSTGNGARARSQREGTGLGGGPDDGVAGEVGGRSH